jgi:hypothetical protein
MRRTAITARVSQRQRWYAAQTLLNTSGSQTPGELVFLTDLVESTASSPRHRIERIPGPTCNPNWPWGNVHRAIRPASGVYDTVSQRSIVFEICASAGGHRAW